MVRWEPTGTPLGQPSGMLEHDVGLKLQVNTARCPYGAAPPLTPPLSGKRCSLKRRSCVDEASQKGEMVRAGVVGRSSRC